MRRQRSTQLRWVLSDKQTSHSWISPTYSLIPIQSAAVLEALNTLKDFDSIHHERPRGSCFRNPPGWSFTMTADLRGVRLQSLTWNLAAPAGSSVERAVH